MQTKGYFVKYIHYAYILESSFQSKLKKYHSCPFGCGESFVSAQLWKHKKKCRKGPEPRGKEHLYLLILDSI